MLSSKGPTRQSQAMRMTVEEGVLRSFAYTAATAGQSIEKVNLQQF